MKKISILLVVMFCLTACTPQFKTESNITTASANTSISSIEMNNSSIIDSPYIISMVNNYYAALSNIYFENQQVVSIDQLVPYFLVHEMRDDDGNIKEVYKQYESGQSLEYQITIPKGIVNQFILNMFCVTLDDSNSSYYPIGRTDVYRLEAEVRDGLYVKCLERTWIDGIINLKCEGGLSLGDNDEPEVLDLFEIGLLPVGTDNFKFAYCRPYSK